ncbi:hypothetical protein GCM10028821_02450 [Hymenobacter jeollabukensis]|uniref:DUF4190 domain-containing protein n=1 Tax=Hymenobacter jeollabukensis TaxID=2025313 RepID=A0A5R8WWR3_9BACT|nr:hypothetical protein FDY95_02895 [Hymenobacter jeollabukensis]
MEPTPPAGASRSAIVGWYRRATFCYALPFGLGLLGAVVPLFFTLALLGILPLALAGLFFTKRGWTLAVRSGDVEKKDVGFANFILGAILLALGLLGFFLAYLMTS